MAKVIVMPKLGYTQDEGQIVAWHKNVGDPVKNGEPFFDVHTDKSVITVEASATGTLLKIVLEPGNTVPVLTPIAVVGDASENPDEVLAGYQTASAADAPVEADFDDAAAEKDTKSESENSISDLKLTPRAKKYIKENEIDPSSITGIKGSGFEGGITEKDIKASPLAKKLADINNVDLTTVAGTGADGKIMKADVIAAANAKDSGSSTMQILKTVPYKGVRKIIGDRLSKSKFTAPHLYFTDSIDTTAFTAFRKTLNETSDVKIAVSDLLIMAASKALDKYPEINSSLVDGSIVYYKSKNIGMAVAGNDGLVVPVVKNAQEKTLTEIAKETRDLVSRAREGRLSPDEYSGGTFSISNLGMFGIGNFTAIINPPEAAILSISSVRKTPVVITDKDGSDAVAIRPMMNVQLSVDHRIIDGLAASQFVEYFKELLENPLRILL